MAKVPALEPGRARRLQPTDRLSQRLDGLIYCGLISEEPARLVGEPQLGGLSLAV